MSSKPNSIWHHVVRANWYRDVWLALISLVLVITALNLQTTSQQVKEGRRFAVSATCAIDDAAAVAGRNILLASAGPATETPFIKRLEAIGYPPLAVRQKQAKQQADVYVSTLRDSLVRVIGTPGNSIVRKDGSLDCVRFAQLSHASR